MPVSTVYDWRTRGLGPANAARSPCAGEWGSGSVRRRPRRDAPRR
ncbi:hypothetical protein [Microbacterium resistens]|nr:hypothetical protein [Microbacterium resistens]